MPFLFFLFDPAEGFGLTLLKGASLSFTSDCTDELWPGRVLEEPLSLENDLDFLGLRLLTPLRPIFFSLFLKSLNYRLDLFLAGCAATLETIQPAHRIT